jgi:SAM-dependent methyltransferase
MHGGDELDQARYRRMRWNTPLSEEHSDTLLDALTIDSASSVLDLGCGWGELLIRAVARGSDGPLAGTGVDTDPALLSRGRALAAQRGLQDVITFTQAAAETWRDPADRVLCIGASHAWGGCERALTALRDLVRPGGRLLFGDGCWERAPNSAALGLFGADVVAVDELVSLALAAGWRILHLSTADQREWDEFESTWRAGREEWLLAHPQDERADSVRRGLDARVAEYVEIYRGVLGFAYLVLAAGSQNAA